MKWVGKVLTITGLVLGIFGAAAAAMFALMLYGTWHPPRPEAEILPWHVAVMALVSAPGPWIFRIGRRVAQEPAEVRIEGDRRPRALLLRPFSADGLVAETQWQHYWTYLLLGRSSFEERLASVMDNLGPPVAIGRPGENVPPYGFARTYVSDDQWKDAVTEHVRTAGWAVFVLTEATDSLMWEIELVQQAGVRVLFVLPPTAARTADWARQYSRIVAEMPLLGPAAPELAAVLCVPDAPPLRIEMGGARSAPVQLRAIREALVPRFL